MNQDNLKKIESESIGIGDKDGFIGRWQITHLVAKDLGRDLWCEGTTYSIAPFSRSKEDFMGQCLLEISRTCSAEFFQDIKYVELKQLYVPLMKVDGRYVCLYSQDPTLSYQFLNNGIAELPAMSLEPFDFSKIKQSKYDFMSIWLSLSDVEYHSKANNLNYHAGKNPEVVLAPVYKLSFMSKAERHTMMSWGDTNLSDLTSTSLPEDYKLTGKSLIYSYPFFTMLLMFLLLSTACGMSIFFAYYKLWTMLEWPYLFRMIALCIPIFLFNAVTIYLIKGFVKFGEFAFLRIEKKISELLQIRYINDNLSKKEAVVKARFSTARFNMPTVDDFDYDISVMEKHFKFYKYLNLKLGLLK